jgi:uncharacterized Zn-finger protein
MIVPVVFEGQRRTFKVLIVKIYNIFFYGHIHFRNEATAARENLHCCTQCTKSFPTSDILKIHLKVHVERRFRCSVCDESFRDSSRLKIHVRAHTGEKPFSCALCPKSFSRHDILKAHSRTHIGEKPYICTLCPKSFV